MPKWKTSVLAFVLAAVALAQMPSSGIMPSEVHRVANRLACLCRSCKNTVGDCAMLQCGYCAPMRQRIAAMQAAGKSDDAIVDAVVAESGREALSLPPAQGFTILAWTMPYIAVLFGLIAIWLFFRRSYAQRRAVPVADPAVLDQYHERIEKDMAKLE